MKSVLSGRSFISSRSRGSRVASGWTRSLMNSCRSLVMVRTSRSSTTVGFPPDLGRLTSIPRYIMGAVSMKISRSTRTTSTSGMTLISAREPRTRPAASAPASVLIAILERLHRPEQAALDHVRQLEREVVHLGGPVPDLVHEVVVGDDRRDRRGQAEEGRDQSLGDPGRDHGQARGALATDLVERGEDAPHCPGEPDERAGAGGRREE